MDWNSEKGLMEIEIPFLNIKKTVEVETLTRKTPDTTESGDKIFFGKYQCFTEEVKFIFKDKEQDVLD